MRQLLILDGHESHESIDFRQLCEQNSITTLCMLAHSSHLLQPLNVAYFSPLKKAYGRGVENLMRSSINHITKLEFLLVFKQAYQESITEKNIYAGFAGASLVPLDSEIVVSKLEIKLRTPSPLAQVE